MKRVLAFLLAVVMVLSLAACSSEKKDYEKAVKLYDEGKYADAAEAFEKLGSYEDSAAYAAKANDAVVAEYLKGHWATKPIDLSNLITDAMGTDMDNSEMDDLRQYFSDIDYSVIMTLDFQEDGSYNLGIDEIEYAVTMEKVGRSVKQGFVDMIDAQLESAAQDVGMTKEQYMDELGIHSPEDILKSSYGIDLDALVDVFVDYLSQLSVALKAAGTYSVENNIISMDFGTGVDKGTLDMSAGTITITEDDVDQSTSPVDETMASMFPMIFTK